MRLQDVWALLKDSWNAWGTDKAPRLGAAPAYYTTFSLAPLLIMVIAIAALVFRQEAVQGKIVVEISWVYYASLVLFFDAEFTKVYAHHYGSRATSAAGPPLPQPRARTPPVVPQGVRSVPSPDYGRYGIAMLSFIIFIVGMIIGARCRARYP